MDELSSLCKESAISLIEDCAQAHGTEYNGKKIGSFGDISCFSFYPSKNLGALGDGGAICTNNITYYNQIKLLRNLGSIKKYEHDVKGTNSRLDTLQACFLLSKFDDTDRCIQHKNFLSKLYLDNTWLSHIKNPDEKVFHSYHLYVGVAFSAVNVLEYSAIREAVKLYSDWPTVPQLFVNGEFVGGCDILVEMYKDGTLQKLLKFQSLFLIFLSQIVYLMLML
jgi:dTDP-4-amino-4,6-dideoxygalactose transaminase